MAALPRNMLDEILCRVSVKDILRFRCVSKGWCARIDSKTFIKKQLRKAVECNAGSALIISDGTNSYTAGFDILDDSSACVVQTKEPIKSLLTDSMYMGACNGLVCVFKNNMHDVFLINPTRKFRKIPHWSHEFPTLFSSARIYRFGFGYDEINDDYKVVKIVNSCSELYGILVYSLKTNAWTHVQIPVTFLFSTTRGVFANGSLHWMASVGPNKCTNVVIAFDFELQQFMEVPLPPIIREIKHYNNRYLVDVQGSLCIIDSYISTCMDVWLMKDFRNRTWYNVLTVEKNSTIRYSRFLKPLAFSKNFSDALLLEVDEKKLLWYNLEKKTVKKVEIGGIPVEFNSFYFIESLLQVNEDVPLQHKKKKNQRKQRDDFLSKGFKLNL